jgi:hypothetical protein
MPCNSIGKCVATALLVLLARSAGAQQRATGESAETAAYREAVNVLQGVDSLPFLDTTRIRLVARALRAIRAGVPQVADITADEDRSSLLIFPVDSAKDVFATRAGVRRPVGQSGIWNVTVPRVGIAAMDSLNRRFGVTSIHITGVGGMSVLYLKFPRPVNLPVIGEYYARVPQVSSAGPDLNWGFGNPDWITLLPREHRLHFVFARGSGDCPSGCVNWDYYYATYDTRDGSVVLERERLHTTKWAEPISYWDIPTRYSINPYPTLDSLFEGLHATRWWYRAHAVHVLGILLGKSTGPWRGAGEQSQAHFDSLEAEVRARRRASLKALIERLIDPDPDVASFALAYLRQVSGRAMPGGVAGVAGWQQWLRESP